MSTIAKKKAVKGVRYTDVQKKEVLDFVSNFNAKNGRGGQTQAAEKFGISQITVAAWLKAAGSSVPVKTPVSTEPSVGLKSQEVAAPKAAASVKTPGVGVRYSPEQKQEVVNFVHSYNKANGRGGQSKAASKFGVSPLTVMAWLKASGAPKSGKKSQGAKAVSAPKAPSVTPVTAHVAAPVHAASGVSGSIGAKLEALGALHKQIEKAEAELASLVAKFAALKNSL